jgi:hypothetical protein
MNFRINPSEKTIMMRNWKDYSREKWLDLLCKEDWTITQ